ncbi:MAG: hypothetical protein QOG53_2310 [Frankiales bacterium]|jgi:hypothetical protein|nr:hypothetical protein [Frankiales bacterium]
MAFKTAEAKIAAREATAARKAQDAQARAAADQQKAAEREEAAFRASPVGQATSANEQGHGFFEIQLTVGSSQRDSTIWGSNNTSWNKAKTQTHAGTLSAIEAAGWRLENVGYIFVITGESSRDKFLASGQQTAVSGHTVGIYLFRNTDTANGARRTRTAAAPA